MLGVYCASAEPSAMVAAGFVAARGWAYETAASRGLTLATLEQLAAAGDLAGLTVARVQVAVGALSTTLLVQGSRDDVALVLRQVQQRLSGERPLPERVPAKVPDGRPMLQPRGLAAQPDLRAWRLARVRSALKHRFVVPHG